MPAFCARSMPTHESSSVSGVSVESDQRYSRLSPTLPIDSLRPATRAATTVLPIPV